MERHRHEGETEEGEAAGGNDAESDVNKREIESQVEETGGEEENNGGLGEEPGDGDAGAGEQVRGAVVDVGETLAICTSPPWRGGWRSAR